MSVLERSKISFPSGGARQRRRRRDRETRSRFSSRGESLWRNALFGQCSAQLDDDNMSRRRCRVHQIAIRNQ